MARGDSRTGEGLLEHAQRETERLATLGPLVACVAHEVNHPISFIALGQEHRAKHQRSENQDVKHD